MRSPLGTWLKSPSLVAGGGGGGGGGGVNVPTPCGLGLKFTVGTAVSVSPLGL